MSSNDNDRSLNIRHLTTLTTPSPALVFEDCPETHAPPGNDNASVAPRSVLDTTRLVAHGDVVRYVRATLARYGVRQRDIDDAVADVQTNAIEAARRKRMPADLEEWKALGSTIAVRWAMKRQRKAKVARRYDAGPCEEPDRYLAPTLYWEQRDPVDTKRYLAILKDLFDAGEMPEDGDEILQGEADGVPHEELARELGIGRKTVDKRLFQMREKFYARLAALGMLVFAMLMVLAVLNRRPEEAAAPAPRDVPASTPAETLDAGAQPDAAGWR